jgi:hypothetical protein
MNVVIKMFEILNQIVLLPLGCSFRGGGREFVRRERAKVINLVRGLG